MEAQNLIQKEALIDAALAVFVRYGAKKTSMSDIADAAGVSRQTLYDLVGGKNEFIEAAIRTVTDRNLDQVRNRLERSMSLERQLHVYFEETVVSSFKLLQSSGDPEDLISGHNEVGKAEIKRSHAKHRQLVAKILKPFESKLERSGHQTKDVAELIVVTGMALKYQADSLRSLGKLLDILTNSIVSLTNE